MIKSIFRFFITWNELLTLPVAILLWIFSADILRLMDPTSAVYDAGVFQVILFAVIQVLFFHAVAWLLLKMAFPGAYRFLDQLLENKETALSEWEKSKTALFLFALYFVAFLIAARVL